MQVSNFLRAHPRLVWAAQLLLALAAAAVGWLQLERSAGQENHVLLALAPQYILLGVLTVFAVPAVIYALCGRWHFATAAGGAAVTVLALVNYYVKMLHGTALMAVDIANAATAADVVGAYSIRPDPTSIKIGLCFLPVLAAAAAQWLLGRPGRKGAPPATWTGRLLRLGGGAAFVLALGVWGYFGPWSLVPNDTAVLARAVAFNYQQYGYTPSLVASVQLVLEPVVQPEGYDADAAEEIAGRAAGYRPAVPAADAGSYPDIVLILNESFYDLSLVTDPRADTPYLDFYRSLADSAVLGYALVPDVGGGTNRSEFELLTSHSLTLLPGVTPFANMSMEGQPSAVSYLESLGYATLAAHPAVASNYRRGMAWPALGFDATAFEQDFAPFTPYGGRIYYVPDADAFDYFTAMYEAMPEDRPRFAYLLTMQNHGGYADVAAEELTVSAAADYGAYEHDVDEYLSCISLTDDALAGLTDYFTDLYRTTGRRVVLLMVGDHAPYLIDELTDSALTGAERTIRQRATPFVLWTNYPAETRVTTGTAGDALPVVDLCALLPMAAEQAGLPLSPYYRYLLAMRQEVSGWTNLDGVLLPDGSVAADGASAEADAWVSGYYMLEYNALTASERVESLFLPETG